MKARASAPKDWTNTGWLTDPEVLLYAAWVSVWGRWFIWALGVFLLAYRPAFWFPQDLGYLLVPVVLGACNGLVHLRLRAKKPVTWRWLLFLGAVDLVLITCAIVIHTGFDSYFFLAYYPALAVIAVVLSSFRLGFAWTTLAAVSYTVVCLAVEPGLDYDAGKDKVLISRIAMMYLLALGIGFIARFERLRWRSSVARERQLREDRIRVSQTIHDTTAQSVYVVGLGIHKARNLIGKSDEELAATLDATLELSRAAMWEMRGPIDAGNIVEGRELGRVIGAHCATFQRITGVPAEVSLSGEEPPLAVETRTRLFSIAHNALTNAFLHAQPGRVEVKLDFGPGQVRLSVSDDGVGLPADYAERGRGFKGMRTDAEQLGGALAVESARDGSGTTITCTVPMETA